MRDKVFIVIGAINGFFAVALGAFGAHGLKSQLSERMLHAFETGVRYQMYHALALVLVGILFQFAQKNKKLAWSGLLFFAGIIFFSGSLYLLAFTSEAVFGFITPLGGFFFLLGWILLATAFFDKEN